MLSSLLLEEKTKVEEIRRALEPQRRKLEGELQELVLGLLKYATQHRERLTEGGKVKTVIWPAGKLQWRLTPRSVRLSDVAKVLAELKKRRLTRYIRVKEEIDRNALLAEEEIASRIPGVEFVQYEQFIVQPEGVTSEITATRRKRTVKVEIKREEGKKAKKQ
jgi:phage host-nuclease inhibitor protein Gam